MVEEWGGVVLRDGEEEWEASSLERAWERSFFIFGRFIWESWVGGRSLGVRRDALRGDGIHIRVVGV